MFELTKPCDQCPFSTKPGAVKLTPERVRELARGAATNDKFLFYCHKTTREDEDDDELVADERSKACAGAVSLQLRTNGLSQMMRISARLGSFDPEKIDHSEVYDSPADMMRGAVLPGYEPEDLFGDGDPDYVACVVSDPGCTSPAWPESGEDAEFVCVSCGEPVCESCSSPAEGDRRRCSNCDEWAARNESKRSGRASVL